MSTRPSLQRSKPIALPVAAALLAGACTVIDLTRPPADDFPKLAITEHYVSWAVMREKCRQADAPGMMSLGCTAYDLIRETCEIWIVAAPKPNPDHIAHERLHCAGYDHVGESTLRDAWQAVKSWRATNSVREEKQ